MMGVNNQSLDFLSQNDDYHEISSLIYFLIEAKIFKIVVSCKFQVAILQHFFEFREK